ncbi:MAG: Crp/Fnr family transcriptional regulator [Anaerolineales bacterium]|nr:Crp/Fnr family transcriptional regulator [Anaerolineales bacterium]
MTKSSLSENQLFSRFSQFDVDRLIDISIEKTYPKDQWITHYGSDWPYLFLVEQGQVTAIKESPEGRSLVVITLDKDEVFWGVGFFKEGIGMPVALVANQETKLRLWSRKNLEPFMINNGQFTWDLAQLMAERMMLASRILEELAFHPVAGRLAHLLLSQFEDQSGDILSRDLTLDDMAARIGSTREMVCRHLYNFADKGAIQINRTEFKITNQGLLQHFAEKGK